MHQEFVSLKNGKQNYWALALVMYEPNFYNTNSGGHGQNLPINHLSSDWFLYMMYFNV